ncbi:GtrA family protein [Corynebacterium amycolatum]|uniref:GtrA family protein n=1 Tax=Corynebacterium amycolatum TaxID=43765 RepID=UPI003AF6D643
MNLVVITLLTNPTSPLALPVDIFDDSTGFRNRLYWANLIGVILGTPANFILNKIWAFRNRGNASKTKEKVVLKP